MRRHYGIKALVIACNTATAAAVELRADARSAALIGVEPALKPASLSSQTHQVG
jgi:glutamate racemase